MKRTIPIHLAVEDELSEWVVRRALASRPVCYEIRTVRSRGGYGALKKQVPAYNLAARHTPFFVLTDLDQHACPPELIANWLCHPKHPQLLLRVAVREVEAWLLADTTGLPTFLGLRKAIAIPHPETLPTPSSNCSKWRIQVLAAICVKPWFRVIERAGTYAKARTTTALWQGSFPKIGTSAQRATNAQAWTDCSERWQL